MIKLGWSYKKSNGNPRNKQSHSFLYFLLNPDNTQKTINCNSTIKSKYTFVISLSSINQTYIPKAQGIGGLEYYLKEDAIS